MTDNPLDDWPRQYYSPGGGNPFLFYFVFGNVGTDAGLSRSKYRSNGLLPDFDLMKYEVLDSDCVVRRPLYTSGSSL